MGLNIDYIEGQTPIDEEEKNGIRIKSITTRAELDEFEQLNIEKAIQWTFGKKWTVLQILTEDFIKQLHYKMFSDVWSWAGEYRKTNKNIGVPYFQIQMSIKQLLDDSMFWHINNTYQDDEFALRFKHRIVSIHCFANGNGRHSRLMADIIINQIFKKQIFTWSMNNLSKVSTERTNYLTAVKAADIGDYSKLISFARM